jgi:hypothetical protein
MSRAFYTPVVVDGTPVLLTREKCPSIRRMKPKKRRSECGVERATPMQKRALENHLFKGMNKSRAMIAAGYTPNGITTQKINNVLQRRPIVAALEKKKITNDTVAGVIAEGLKAMRPDDHKFPDHSARAPYVREVNRIVGNYAPTTVQVQEKALVVHITSEDAERFQKYRRMRRENGDSEDDTA